MTKLRRKLQQLAKKRAHKKTVQKRKVVRATKEIAEKKAAEEERLAALVEQDMLRLSDPSAETAGTVPLSSSEKQLIGGLVMNSGPAIKKGSKKQLTRKQTRRKEKGIEKGEAIAEQLDKKWNHKKIRVKIRAQVRNAELQN